MPAIADAGTDSGIAIAPAAAETPLRNFRLLKPWRYGTIKSSNSALATLPSAPR